MWVAEDRDSYKNHLAATLFADVLNVGNQEARKSENEEIRNLGTEELRGQGTEEIRNQRNEKTLEAGTEDKAKSDEEEYWEYHEEKDMNDKAQETKQAEEAAQEKKVQAEQNTNKNSEKKDASIYRQWKSIKDKHPDAVLLFRVGDFYKMYNDDARKGANILGITLSKQNSGSMREYALFPHHALDTYLPKLIRPGERVAICDLWEETKQQQTKGMKEQEEATKGMRR